MMDEIILISNINDFVFCPASIYFHNLYGSQSRITFQQPDQINGTKAHEAIDQGRYSTRKDVITALDVYSEKYNVVGKIDIYDGRLKTLVERKRTIKRHMMGIIFKFMLSILQWKKWDMRSSILNSIV